MNAEEKFKELGYTKEIIKNENGETIEILYKMEKEIDEIYVCDEIYVWFYLDSKTLSVEDNGGYDIDMKLLQAINQQCKDFGWLDD